MAKYEFKTLNGSGEDLEKTLTDFSSEGWEVITAETIQRGTGGWLWAVILKREVPEALKPRRIEIATRHDSVGQAKVTTLEHNKAA